MFLYQNIVKGTECHDYSFLFLHQLNLILSLIDNRFIFRASQYLIIQNVYIQTEQRHPSAPWKRSWATGRTAPESLRSSGGSQPPEWSIQNEKPAYLSQTYSCCSNWVSTTYVNIFQLRSICKGEQVLVPKVKGLRVL